MRNVIKLLVCLVMLHFIGSVSAGEVSREQIKGLDEQVQEIKSDVLAISAELNQLEEKLLYPSDTQMSFFVSVMKDSGFQPDAIQLQLDGKDVAYHIYSYKEVEALHDGGVQRIYTGNVMTGQHSLQVSVNGKQGGSERTDSDSHTLDKGVGPQFVEIVLSGSGIGFRDW